MNKIKILIIGYGSIGKKHERILTSINKNNQIFILTSQNIKKKNIIKDISEIKKINPDYIVICSQTSDHYKQLKYIEENLKKKKILVEKPLFHKNLNLLIKNNKVFVAYNFRFNPIINYIKNLKKQKIFSLQVVCGSYLPYWRKNIDYKKSYSSSKKRGGGVLLDLSHELDYIQFLFGKITKINYAGLSKISNLKIKSEDNLYLVAKIKKINLVVSLNYYFRNPTRIINLDGDKHSVSADLNNKSVIFNKSKKPLVKKFFFNHDLAYILQHKAILNNDFRKLCDYNHGLEIMRLISRIKKFKK